MGATFADFVSEQIDRWERFAGLLERTIDRAERVQLKPGAHECGDPRCNGVELSIDDVEAMQRARDLCLMEAEQWRARQRQQPRDTRNAVATGGTNQGGA